jgi:tetratricopeptide (TPR) repeat protein
MGVHNEVGGTVNGPVVQANEVHGDVVFRSECHESRAPVTPRQVPRGPSRFVGREHALSVLDGGGVVALSGLSGVGKRAVARWWATGVQERFTGGDVYVDFAGLRTGGTERAGADVSAAVSQCLRGLGVEDACLPRSLGELSALFRTRTAGERVLVVLEGVQEAAQVRALLPGAGPSVVVAVGGGRLAGLVMDGAEFVHLDPLDAAHGRELLEQLCGAERVAAEPEAAVRIVEWCGGLPVALYVAAARLVVHRRLTLGMLAGELADEKQRLSALKVPGESVVAVFGVAYEGLPEEARRVYRLLGLYPGRSWEAGLAAAVAGGDGGSAQDALDVLEEASLVEVADDGRYAFHDLVRLHARQVAEDAREDAGQVVESALGYMSRLAAHADLAVMGGRMRAGRYAQRVAGEASPFREVGGDRGRGAALEWLEAERAEILAVLREAAARELHQECAELAEAMTALYLNRRYVGDWLASGEIGVRAAEAAGLAASEARLRALLSRPLMDLGEKERAREELETAVARADESGWLLLRASVREFHGRWYDRYAPDRAVGVYREALALYEEDGDPRGIAVGLYFLGCAQDAAGEGEAALATLRDAGARFAGVGDRRMGARARAAEGGVLLGLGRRDEAVAALAEAAAALEGVGAVHYEAVHREALHRLTGEMSQLERALEIYEAAGSPRAEEVRLLLERGPDAGEQA